MSVVQLSLEVRRHPSLEARGSAAGILVGVVKLSGGLPVDRDLNAGDVLTVTVANQDGEVVGSGVYEVRGVALDPIVDGRAGVIGTERVHRARAVG